MEKFAAITTFIQENLTTWSYNFPWLVLTVLILPTFLLAIHSISFWRSKNSYLDGFKAGFNKAFDVMAPLMADAAMKSKETIRRAAVEETRRHMESLIRDSKKNKN